jgi:GT2 family glycosyltransferase
MVHLSLVVASLNEGAELYETLRSARSGVVVPGEIVVIDDGSTDGSCDELNEQQWRDDGVRLIRGARLGIAGARNAGCRAARGTNLVVIDAHCHLERDCLAVLTAALEKWPEAIIAPAIRDRNDTVYGCGVHLVDARLRVRWLSPPPMDGGRYELPLAPGGCLAMRRATFERLGGFGSFRQLGQEDVEFGLRAWRAGVTVLAAPAARLEHLFRSTPSYPVASTTRAYNVARVALTHFDGPRRYECLRTIIGTPRAAEALLDAITSDWQAERARIDAISVREVEGFFDRFGDWS